MNKKEKKFDAVIMMRTIREKVQSEWQATPELIEAKLKKIRKKLKIKEIAQPEKSV